MVTIYTIICDDSCPKRTDPATTEGLVFGFLVFVSTGSSHITLPHVEDLMTATFADRQPQKKLQ